MARPPFPHLLPKDAELWQLYLDTHPDEFLAIDYDVRVGEGRPMPGLADPALEKMAIELSQRRIDCVGHTQTGSTIIEVTMSAGLKTIGQVQAYPILYRETFPNAGELQTLIVANRIQADMRPVLSSLQLRIWTPTIPLPE